MKVPESNLQSIEWIEVGQSTLVEHKGELKDITSRTWRTVKALEAPGGFVVRIYESHLSTRERSLFGGSISGSESTDCFIPAKSIDELRAIFFEEKPNDG